MCGQEGDEAVRGPSATLRDSSQVECGNHSSSMLVGNLSLSDCLTPRLAPRGDRRDAEAGPQGDAVAVAEVGGEPRRGAGREEEVGGGVGAEPVAGDGLLPEGGSPPVLRWTPLSRPKIGDPSLHPHQAFVAPAPRYTTAGVSYPNDW